MEDLASRVAALEARTNQTFQMVCGAKDQMNKIHQMMLQILQVVTAPDDVSRMSTSSGSDTPPVAFSDALKKEVQTQMEDFVTKQKQEDLEESSLQLSASRVHSEKGYSTLLETPKIPVFRLPTQSAVDISMETASNSPSLPCWAEAASPCRSIQLSPRRYRQVGVTSSVSRSSSPSVLLRASPPTTKSSPGGTPQYSWSSLSWAAPSVRASPHKAEEAEAQNAVATPEDRRRTIRVRAVSPKTVHSGVAMKAPIRSVCFSPTRRQDGPVHTR